MKYVKVNSEVEAFQLTVEKAKQYLEFGNLPMGLQITHKGDEAHPDYEFLSFGLTGIQKGQLGDWYIEEQDGSKYFLNNSCFSKNFIELK